MRYFVGVDVSKTKLDVALLLANEKFRSKSFTNDGQGFKTLLEWPQTHAIGTAELHLCMEATGTYHEPLAYFMHDQGLVT